jgi:hypothetical protein
MLQSSLWSSSTRQSPSLWLAYLKYEVARQRFEDAKNIFYRYDRRWIRFFFFLVIVITSFLSFLCSSLFLPLVRSALCRGIATFTWSECTSSCPTSSQQTWRRLCIWCRRRNWESESHYRSSFLNFRLRNKTVRSRLWWQTILIRLLNIDLSLCNDLRCCVALSHRQSWRQFDGYALPERLISIRRGSLVLDRLDLFPLLVAYYYCRALESQAYYRFSSITRIIRLT